VRFQDEMNTYNVKNYFTDIDSCLFFPIKNYNDAGEEISIFEHFSSNFLPKNESIVVKINFFYSFRDLSYLFGNTICQYCTLRFPKNRNNFIVQKNKIDGSFEYNANIKIVLKDSYGWSSKGGFKKLCSTLGINGLYKNNCELYKASMEKYFETEEDTLKFVNYSINDIVLLEKVRQQMPVFINRITKSVLEKELFTEEKIPDSIGSIVANIVEEFIFKHFDQYNLRKQFQVENTKWGIRITYKNPEKVSTLLGGASVKSFFYKNSRHTGILNSIVQGGRTYNERPEEFLIQNVADLDITSCYSTALTDFSIPIGLPTIKAFYDPKQRITLKQFLEENGSELVDNFYTITISGKLSFTQTLLYSKDIQSKEIVKKLNKILSDFDDEITEEVTGDYCVLKKELFNTIITSDILNALQKICSSQELNEIMNCQVETAAYYKKSDMMGPEEFIQQLQKQSFDESYSYSDESSEIKDTRPRCWTPIPLKELVQPLKDLRTHHKNLVKQGIDIDENQGMQELIKLLSNTIYGVLASPYFSIGNTIVANNITARARLAIWMTSRSIQGFQSITDGCMYQPDHLLMLNATKYCGQKPSLSTLSDNDKLKRHRSIRKTSLGNLDWTPVFTREKELEDYPNMDILMNTHIKEFWKEYDLVIPYDFEHKIAGIAVKLFYIKKSHYVYLDRYGKITYKIRGLNPNSENPLPIYIQFATSLLTGNFTKIHSLEHMETRIAKISDHLCSKTKDIIVFPGYLVQEVKKCKITNSDFSSDTLKEHHQKKKYEKDYASLLLNSETIQDITNILEYRVFENTKTSKNLQKNP
jgi:hypothetical protein